MIAIIIGIVLFMVLVLVHERGHFITAKKSGVKVLEFGIGIPPKILTFYKDKSGTEYTLNLIPLGGFVRLKGENPNEPDVFFAKDSFITAKLWKKIIILFAGVTMNLIFAWFLFTLAFINGIKPLQVVPVNMLGFESQSYILPSYDFLKKQGFISGEISGIPVKIEQIIPSSIGDKKGLISGDIITHIDNKQIDSLSLSPTLREYIGKEFNLKYKRESQEFSININCPEDSCILGIILNQGGNYDIKTIKFNIFGAMAASIQEIKAETHITYYALGNLFKNFISFDKERINSSVEKMSGPVGAVKVGEIILTQFGFWQYLAFGAMISLALALFNILPIPALDGGRAAGVIIQSIFKLPAEKYFSIENYFNIFFFIVLLFLGIYVIFIDLYRFWGVKIPGFN